jgi:hypothetical protein
MLQHEPTEGEEFIEMYFQEEGIKYEREVEIAKLVGDDKGFRRADFYLPKYKVYVEFFGMNNVPDGRRGYYEKKAVYERNNVPCVYIYPDNLGTLGFMFKSRLKKELENHPELKSQLFRFNFWRFFRLNQSLWTGLCFIVLLAVLAENMINGVLLMSWFSTGILFVLFVVALISVGIGVKRIFFEKRGL